MVSAGGIWFNDGTNQTTAGGGGGGSIPLTVGAVDPDIAPVSCTAPATNTINLYFNNVLFTLWQCVATNTWQKILATNNIGTWGFIGNTGSPIAGLPPSSGSVGCWLDTSGTQKCEDSSSSITTMVKIIKSTSTLGTSSITANSCATVVTTTATGVASTDVISWTPNADISGQTGYSYTATDGLKI